MVQPLSSQNSEFGSDLKIFTEVENCWRRDTIKGGDVLSKIAEEVDDKSRRRQQQKPVAAAVLAEVGRPVRSTDVHSVHRSQAVDRSGRPTGRPNLRAELVDRPGRPTWKKTKPTVRIGRPERSTDQKEKVTGRIGRPVRSTDRRVWAKNCCSANCGAAGINRMLGCSRVSNLRK